MALPLVSTYIPPLSITSHLKKGDNDNKPQ